jgi:hypothetical protein
MLVELQIESLMLDGFPAMDYERCGAALRAELTRLVEERGVPAAWRESWRTDSHRLEPLALPRSVEPEWVGVQLARQLYENLIPSLGASELGASRTSESRAGEPLLVES